MCLGMPLVALHRTKQVDSRDDFGVGFRAWLRSALAFSSSLAQHGESLEVAREPAARGAYAPVYC